MLFKGIGQSVQQGIPLTAVMGLLLAEIRKSAPAS